MYFQLLHDETVLFRLNTFAYLYHNNPPLFMPPDFLHGQGNLYLTNLRLVYIGAYQTKKIFRFNRRTSFYNVYQGDASFEVPIKEMLDMKLCNIGGIFPIGVEVLLASGRTVLFALFGRKRFYKAYKESCIPRCSVL